MSCCVNACLQCCYNVSNNVVQDFQGLNIMVSKRTAQWDRGRVYCVPRCESACCVQSIPSLPSELNALLCFSGGGRGGGFNKGKAPRQASGAVDILFICIYLRAAKLTFSTR